MNYNPEKTIKKAVIYCRVSTKEQVEEGNSLVTQEKNCREFALKENFEVIEQFIEQGESAKTQDRTELQKLLTFCANKGNKVNAVIIYKIDRLSRNTDDYSQIRLLLKKYGVEIKSTTEYFENTPAGRFMENIIANVAQFDNDVRTERSVGGMKEAIRSGRYVWNAPLGYDNVRINGKATIAPNSKAPLILKAFEEIAKNTAPVEEIRRQLLKEGLTNVKGKFLSKSQFYCLIKNEVYNGTIRKFNEVHTGTYDPIVSVELYNQVQRVLRYRRKKSYIIQREHPDFPLRRFISHPTGKKLTGSWSKGRNKNYAYYRFFLPGMEFTKSEVDNLYADYLNSFALTDRAYDKFQKAIIRQFGKATTGEKSEIEVIKKSIKELEEKLDFAFDQKQKGSITQFVFDRQTTKIEEQITDLYSSMLTKSEETFDVVEVLPFAEEYIKNPGKIWLEAKYERQIQLQWFEFPKGITFDGEILRTPEICSIFKTKGVFLPGKSYNVHPIKFSSNFPPEVANLPYLNGDNLNTNSTEIDWVQIKDDLIKLAEILRPEPIILDTS